MKFDFRSVTKRWVDVNLSTDTVTQHLGMFDHEQLTRLRDELAEALADAEYHLNRMAPEDPTQ